ncbi:MAG TPA: PEGA domain-containing protein [Kiritimatiellia bacterium]|nr:PEGA domain-containing protein [Kiritimatiellia bacterium]
MSRRLIHSLAALLLAGLLPHAEAQRVKPAQLVVSTTPPGAEILIDGAVRGISPLTATDLAPGSYVVTARRDGFRPARRAVSLMADQRLALDLTLEEIQGLVLFTGTPEGAEVHVNNAFRGALPLFIADFPSGTHRVRVSHPGYFDKELELTVADRIPQQVQVALVPDSAALEITSQPSGANVVLNGTPRGQTPLTLERTPTGNVTLELRLAGHEPFKQDLTLRAGERQTIRAPLAPLRATLEIISQPAGGRVYVDDTYRGDTPLTLDDLPAGGRRVRVEARGHAPDARTVTLRAGEKSVEEFRLQLNSGILILTSDPAGAKVFINGRESGDTRLAATGLVSEPLQIADLPQGEHTLQLTKAGYRHTPRRFTITVGKATTLNERLVRLFVPDTEVRIGTGPSGLRTGMLRRQHPNGDIELETRPGVMEYIPADTILSRRPLAREPAQ